MTYANALLVLLLASAASAGCMEMMPCDADDEMCAGDEDVGVDEFALVRPKEQIVLNGVTPAQMFGGCLGRNHLFARLPEQPSLEAFLALPEVDACKVEDALVFDKLRLAWSILPPIAVNAGPMSAERARLHATATAILVNGLGEARDVDAVTGPAAAPLFPEYRHEATFTCTWGTIPSCTAYVPKSADGYYHLDVPMLRFCGGLPAEQCGAAGGLARIKVFKLEAGCKLPAAGNGFVSQCKDVWNQSAWRAEVITTKLKIPNQ